MEEIKKKLSKKKIILIVIASLLTVAIIAGAIALIVFYSKRVKPSETVEITVHEGCSDYYFNCLDNKQKRMYATILKEAESVLYDGAEKNSLGVYKYKDYEFNDSQALEVWYAFRYDCPAFFMVSHEYVVYPTSMEVLVAPEFANRATREQMKEKIKASVDEVKTLVSDVEDDILKFKIIYDYVMNNTDYNYDSNGNAVDDGYSCSIAGALDGNENTKSICQGYAQSVSYLCNVFGINCIYVGSEKANHALNIVQIGDYWYYVDSTVDDNDKEDYQYFLKGEDLRWLRFYQSASSQMPTAKMPRLGPEGFNRRHVTYKGLKYNIINKKNCSLNGYVDDGKIEVSIPDEVKGMSVRTIESGTFAGCSSLVSVKNLPDGMTAIEDNTFSYYTSLTEIQIPESAKSIGTCAFVHCSSLKNITIPAAVTNIGLSAFEDCKSLQSIIIPNDDAKLGNAAFRGCSNLESIGLPANLTEIDGLFADCVKLSDITISDTVKKIASESFVNCNALASIDIPIGVEFIDREAFKNCANLIIYCQIDEEPKEWGYFWHGGHTVKWGIGVDHAVTENGLHWQLTQDGVAILSYSGTSAHAEIPSQINGHSVKIIKSGAFENLEYLLSVGIPIGIEMIENHAFDNCNNLTIYCQASQKPDNWHDEWNCARPVVFWNSKQHGITQEGVQWTLTADDVMTISGYDMKSKRIVIPSQINGYTVTRIEDAFKGWGITFLSNKDLISVEIPRSIEYIKQDAFNFSDKLLTIYCEVENKPEGWDIGWNRYIPVVWDCKNNEVAEDGYIYYVVDDCIKYALKDGEAKLDKTVDVSGDIVIAKSVVYKGVEYAVTSIGPSAFDSSYKLTSVRIPDSVTHIGNYAFRGCFYLEKIFIPDSVIGLGEYFVSAAKNLTIYCQSESQPVGWDVNWNKVNVKVVWGYVE